MEVMNNDQAMSLNVMCTLPMIKEENELNYALRKKIQVRFHFKSD